MYFLAVNKFKQNINPLDISRVIPIHIKWAKEMISEGKIVQVGKWGEIGGVSIFKAEDITEAEKILHEDPLIKSGLVAFEIARFYPDVDIYSR